MTPTEALSQIHGEQGWIVIWSKVPGAIGELVNPFIRNVGEDEVPAVIIGESNEDEFHRQRIRVQSMTETTAAPFPPDHDLYFYRVRAAD